MDIRDSQRIKEIRDNTRAMAEAFSSIASTLADALELYISTRTETQTETQNSNLTFKTLEYCDICDHKGCEECIANALDEHCMPSQFNKQIEDECAKEYEELGLKELKELIEADRKTENSSEIPNNCDTCRNKGFEGCEQPCLGCGCCGLYEPKDEPSNSEIPNNCEHITEDGVTCAKYPACDDCPDNPLNKVKGSERLLKGKTEPTISKMEQVDKDINVRSKDCETCKHYKLACELFSEICKYEPTTQTETQNSNFKRTMRDCYNCKRYVTEGECIECHYEPKDEPQTEPLQTCSVNGRPYSECGSCEHFKCTADEPQTDYNKSLELFAEMLFDKEKSEQFLKECKAMGIEPQTDCSWK